MKADIYAQWFMILFYIVGALYVGYLAAKVLFNEYN